MDNYQDQLDSMQQRIHLLEQQSIMIARMDENIGFIRRNMEDGNHAMLKFYDRLSALEKMVPVYEQTVSNIAMIRQEVGVLKRSVPAYDQTVNGFIVAKAELGELRNEVREYKAINRGKWVTLSTITVIIVGVVNMVMLWLQ